MNQADRAQRGIQARHRAARGPTWRCHKLRTPKPTGEAEGGPNRARSGYSETAFRTATRGLNTNSLPQVQSDLKSLYESTRRRHLATGEAVMFELGLAPYDVTSGYV
jgi:hypothetical protein